MCSPGLYTSDVLLYPSLHPWNIEIHSKIYSLNQSIIPEINTQQFGVLYKTQQQNNSEETVGNRFFFL